MRTAAVDFFARQDAARRRTLLLLALFVVSLCATVVLVYGVFRWAADLAPGARLPLADLCLPALKSLSLPQFRAFKQGIDLLAGADGAIDLFEYVMARTLGRILSASLGGEARPLVRISSLPRVAAEASVLLTCMARAGQTDETRARPAFEASVRALPSPAGDVRFLPAAEAGLEAVDEALARLLLATPDLRGHLVDACLKGLLHDGRAADDELQLLRAVAAALDCPLPAWTGGANGDAASLGRPSG